MKRGKKLIALMGVLAVLLAATYAASLLSAQEETVEEDAVAVFSVDTGAVTALSWDYSEALAFTFDGESWQYAADEAFPLDESYISTALETLSEITSAKTIEAPEDLDQYGLAEPVCTITLTAGESYSLAIGQETGMGGQRYFSNGDGNVYLVDESVIDPFCYGLYDLLLLETIPTMENVTAMALQSQVQSYEILYQEDSGLAYSDAYVWFMDGQPLDTELTNALVETVSTLSWTECVDYNAADLSAYGLDAPTASVTIDYADGSFVLELGSTTDSGCYARIAGSSMVYLIDPTVLDTLLYTTQAELMPDEVLVMDWENVTAMEILLDDAAYEITCSTQAVTDDEGNESEETVYTLNGESIDISGVTSALDAMVSTGYAAGVTAEGNEEIRFVIHRERETFPEVELAFYSYDSTSCAVQLNGESTVYVDRTAVAELVETVAELVASE